MKSSTVSMVERYLAALHESDPKGLEALFSEDAEIDSALFGKISPKNFFPLVFANGVKAEIVQSEIYTSVESGDRASAFFTVNWHTPNGILGPIKCVDILTVGKDQKFSGLTIVFDTAIIRQAMGGEYSLEVPPRADREIYFDTE